MANEKSKSKYTETNGSERVQHSKDCVLFNSHWNWAKFIVLIFQWTQQFSFFSFQRQIFCLNTIVIALVMAKKKAREFIILIFKTMRKRLTPRKAERALRSNERNTQNHDNNNHHHHYNTYKSVYVYISYQNTGDPFGSCVIDSNHISQ